MTQTTLRVVQKRVRQGIAHLNTNYPGWLEKINADELDISSFTHCVLGQLEGSYAKGLERLGSNDGFLLGFEGSDLIIDEELTEEWRRSIRELRAEKESASSQAAA